MVGIEITEYIEIIQFIFCNNNGMELNISNRETDECVEI